MITWTRQTNSGLSSRVGIGAWAFFLALAALTGSSSAFAQNEPDYSVWLPYVRNAQTPANPIHQGVATYYDADGGGSCMFGPSPSDLMIAAMNEPDYGNANYCGAYVHVTGPKGVVTVRIVDMCPGCRVGLLDLSPQAFAQIADLPLGRVPVTWQVISPEISGPIAYHFKDGSNQWWTAVQVRNHRNPIAKFEYLNTSGLWVTVGRVDYNYFIQTNPGMGPGPYTFRVTDGYGHVLVDREIPHVENATASGAAQFPKGP